MQEIGVRSENLHSQKKKGYKVRNNSITPSFFCEFKFSDLTPISCIRKFVQFVQLTIDH
jgi:hypothetical protein